VRKPPQPPILPDRAWINPPPKKTMLQDVSGSTIATSDDVWVAPVSDLDVSLPSMPELVKVVH